MSRDRRRGRVPRAPLADRARAALRAVLHRDSRDPRVRSSRRDRLGRLAGEPHLLALRPQLRTGQLGEEGGGRPDDPDEVLPRSRPPRVDVRSVRTGLVVGLAHAFHARRGRSRDTRKVHRRLPDRRDLPVFRATCVSRSTQGESRELRRRRGHARSNAGGCDAGARDRAIRSLRIPVGQRRCRSSGRAHELRERSIREPHDARLVAP